MSIQQNINQTLSLASFVMGQTPMAAAKREEVLRQRELKRIGKEIDAVYPEVKNAAEIEVPGNTPEQARAAERALQRNIELQERAYELDPSGERWDALSVAYEEESAFQEKRAEEGRKENARIERARIAREDKKAARELERQKQLGPKGISRELVESRLWKREDKK